MSKTAKDTRGTAKCETCIFGRPVTISDRDKSGKETRYTVKWNPADNTVTIERM